MDKLSSDERNGKSFFEMFPERGPEMWKKFYELERTPWYKDEIHKYLDDNLAELFQDPERKYKVFIPLCGRALELKWFAELGHDVVGIDISDSCKVLFEENNIEYEEEIVPEIEGKVFKESGFDAIWDCSALGALCPNERISYNAMMKSVKTKDCSHLVIVQDWGLEFMKDMRKVENSPPFMIPLEELQSLLGTDEKVTLLCKRKFTEAELKKFKFEDNKYYMGDKIYRVANNV